MCVWATPLVTIIITIIDPGQLYPHNKPPVTILRKFGRDFFHVRNYVLSPHCHFPLHVYMCVFFGWNLLVSLNAWIAFIYYFHLCLCGCNIFMWMRRRLSLIRLCSRIVVAQMQYKICKSLCIPSIALLHNVNFHVTIIFKIILAEDIIIKI